MRLAYGHRYRAASLTKPRVAWEVRRLAGRGALALDVPVRSLLPQLEFAAHGAGAVTVRQLLQHTAGLAPSGPGDPLFRRGAASVAGADCAAAARHVARHRPPHAPGRSTRYSNAGYCLLGEILLARMDAQALAASGLEPVLRSPLGAAGGWADTLAELHAGLHRTLPLERLDPPPQTLPDGSWYAYGWRYWPVPGAGAPWTHTGRLEGMVAVALTDGEDRLLVAHFDGDPGDHQAAAARFGRQAWPCMSK